MNKKTFIYIVICLLFGWLLVNTAAAQTKGVFDPDVELKIPGLVCPSCAIGIKNGFKKTKLTRTIKFDGYELKSIKWLKDKKPNRYNKP